MTKRRLKVDLEELMLALGVDHDEMSYYLDTVTGEVVLVVDEEIISIEPLEIDQGGRHIPVPTVSTQEQYRDVEDFIETVASPELQGRLAEAILGRGAFRRFKDLLAMREMEQKRWYAFKEARMRARALEWLEGLEGLGIVAEETE